MLEKKVKNDCKELGNKGEDMAISFLIGKGYKIIDRNFNCRQGEIDIIAKDKKEIIFIEVKTRRNMNYGEPIDAVTFQKKKHILDASKYYLYINNLNNSFVRFDIVEIYILDKNIKINQIKNVSLN